jgi:hypothetical protein
VAEPLQSLNEVTFELVGRQSIEIVCAQVLIVALVFLHRVADDQDGGATAMMARCFPRLRKPPELGREIGVLCACCCPGRLADHAA